jgi:hypothetical protein
MVLGGNCRGRQGKNGLMHIDRPTPLLGGLTPQAFMRRY